MIGYLVLTARFAMATVLFLSVAAKLGERRFREFRDWLRALAVVPERRVLTVGALIVTTEMSILVLLLLPATGPAGLVLAAVTMTFFAGAAMFLRGRGISVPCRCFGMSRTPMGLVEITRNLLLAMVTAAGAWVAFVDPPQASSPMVVAMAVSLGIAIGLVTARIDDLRELFAPAR